MNKGLVGNKTYLDLNATFFKIKKKIFFLPFKGFKCVWYVIMIWESKVANCHGHIDESFPSFHNDLDTEVALYFSGIIDIREYNVRYKVNT